MKNKSITPNPQQPVDRVPTGQLPSALAELSEAALNATLRSDVLPLNVGQINSAPWDFCSMYYCSYDGDVE
jgi:bacteriocin leader peptide (microcyclamide/patellamide family)